MNTATLKDPQAEWHDSRRYWWLLSLLTMLLPVGALLLVAQTGWPLMWWFGFLFVFGVIPLFDVLLGEETANPPEERVADLEADRYYRWAVYLSVPLLYGAFLAAAWVAATWDLAWYSYLGLAISTGCATGIAINTGHELGHKPDPLEKWLAKLALDGIFVKREDLGAIARQALLVACTDDPSAESTR